MKDDQPGGPILLYDGFCGFCTTSVRTILHHDARGTMRFAALQSGYGEAVRTRHPELRDVDSMVLVEHASDTGEERVFVRSNAALRIAAYLGGGWRFFLSFISCRAPCAMSSMTRSRVIVTGCSAGTTVASCLPPKCAHGSSIQRDRAHQQVALGPLGVRHAMEPREAADVVV